MKNQIFERSGRRAEIDWNVVRTRTFRLVSAAGRQGRTTARRERKKRRRDRKPLGRENDDGTCDRLSGRWRRGGRGGAINQRRRRERATVPIGARGGSSDPRRARDWAGPDCTACSAWRRENSKIRIPKSALNEGSEIRNSDSKIPNLVFTFSD